jgi:hypothetical protein
VLLVCTVYSVLYSEIAPSRKPFGIGHIYIHTFFSRITDAIFPQKIDISFWNILYNILELIEVRGHQLTTQHCLHKMRIYKYLQIISSVRANIFSLPVDISVTHSKSPSHHGLSFWSISLRKIKNCSFHFVLDIAGIFGYSA